MRFDDSSEQFIGKCDWRSGWIPYILKAEPAEFVDSHSEWMLGQLAVARFWNGDLKVAINWDGEHLWVERSGVDGRYQEFSFDVNGDP